MNELLDLDSIAAHGRTVLGATVARVGTGYDRDYWTAFPKTFPAVWVGAQRHVRGRDDGRGLTGRVRQHLESEVAFRLVVQRFADGQTSGAPALKALLDATCNAYLGYTPAGADFPFVFVSITDGPASESILEADLVLATKVTFSRNVS